MRKILFLMLGILMFSCNKEDVLDTPTPNTGSPSEMRFSGVKRSPQIKGVAQLNNLWRPGSTITIKFLDGDEEEQESVKNYAKEWLEYANIKFKYVTDGDALVRISFKADRCVSWSYTGSDCKIEQNQNKPTANLDAYEYLTENEKKADVLRLFGQILGLELEHRHLDVDPKWRPKLESYWTDNFEDIPWESLKKYVYDPLLEEDVDQTKEFDDESIMLWQFPSNCTLNSSLKYSNFKLSEKDIEFIGKLYPFKKSNFTFEKVASTENMFIELGHTDNKVFSVEYPVGVVSFNSNFEKKVEKTYDMGSCLLNWFVDIPWIMSAENTLYFNTNTTSACVTKSMFYNQSKSIEDSNISKYLIQSIEDNGNTYFTTSEGVYKKQGDNFVELANPEMNGDYRIRANSVVRDENNRLLIMGEGSKGNTIHKSVIVYTLENDKLDLFSYNRPGILFINQKLKRIDSKIFILGNQRVGSLLGGVYSEIFLNTEADFNFYDAISSSEGILFFLKKSDLFVVYKLNNSILEEIDDYKFIGKTSLGILILKESNLYVMDNSGNRTLIKENFNFSVDIRCQERYITELNGAVYINNQNEIWKLTSK